jgi:hypothetical protein
MVRDTPQKHEIDPPHRHRHTATAPRGNLRFSIRHKEGVWRIENWHFAPRPQWLWRCGGSIAEIWVCAKHIYMPGQRSKLRTNAEFLNDSRRNSPKFELSARTTDSRPGEEGVRSIEKAHHHRGVRAVHQNRNRPPVDHDEVAYLSPVNEYTDADGYRFAERRRSARLHQAYPRGK